MPRVRSTLFGIGFQRNEKARLGREKTKRRRQDANDLSWDTVHADLTTNNVRIRIETLPPKGVRQNSDVPLIDRFFFSEAATHRQAYPESREELRGSANDSDLLGRPRFADDFAPFHPNRQTRESRDVAAPLV